MQAVVLGAGAVGTRAARQLAVSADVWLCDRNHVKASRWAEVIGPNVRAAPFDLARVRDCGVVLVAAPVDPAMISAVAAVGVPVVSVADGIHEVTALLELDRAAHAGRTVVVAGAGMAPGLTDVLARYAAVGFDTVEEIHVAKAGTAGPACARQHHRALSQEALDWRDGSWVRRPRGSGRELCWFPDPVGGRDCYRAGLPDALLLVPAFPGVRRVTARVAATRRDRLTGALPMLRPPHPEGEVGAVRVEIRGSAGGARAARVVGAVDRPGAAAGAVAAVAALWAAEGRLARCGAAGLGELVGPDAGPFLAELARRGVRVEAFEGSPGL